MPPTLPLEIHLQILHHALTTPTPLSFCPLPLPVPSRRTQLHHLRDWKPSYSSTLRLALLHKCTHNEPLADSLSKTYNSLCLVSKSTRLITQQIFFGDNKWVLHITKTFDAISWICKTWGKEVLGLMAHIRVEAQSLRKETFAALEVLVEQINNNQGGKQNSRTLEIEWVQHSRPLQCARKAGQTWHFHPLDRDYGLERNADRGRGLIVPEGDEDNYDEDDHGTRYEGKESEPEDWLENEVVLLPLGALRGVEDLRIEGTVTEDWALWLESAGMAKVGEEVDDFKFGKRGRDAISKLRSD